MQQISSFSGEYIPKETDFDCYARLKPSCILRHAQQFSQDHLDTYGLSWDVFERNGCAFLLARLSLIILKDPPCRAHLAVHTTPIAPQRAVYRRYTSYTGDGGEIASIDSMWTLVDTQRMRIMRRPPDEIEMSFSGETVPEHPESDSGIWHDNFSEIGKIKAKYSLCDHFGHVNNAAYADIAMDALPEADQRRPVARITIRYASELRLNASARLFLERADNACRIRAESEDDAAVFDAAVFFRE